MKRMRNDDRGVTLIELIVAVAIFSIVALILLRAFVTSSRINKKSQVYLEATTIAQNLTESIKGKTFEETALAFNYPINKMTKSSRFSFLEDQMTGGTAPDICEVLPVEVGSKTTYEPVLRYEEAGKNPALINSSIYSDTEGNTYTFKSRTKGDLASKYYFQMKGVEGETQSFDVLATFDGSKDTGYKKESYNQEDEKNDYEMPNIAQLDAKSNGFLIMGKEWDRKAIENMVEKQNELAMSEYRAKGGQEPAILSVDDVYSHTKRILQIQIVEEGGVVTAKARYTLYSYGYSTGNNPYETMGLCPCGGHNLGKEREDEDWISGCFCTYVSSYTAFYSSEAGEDLKGIYVFYSPNYNSTSGANPLDEIQIDNEYSKAFDLYVVKQQDETYTGNLAEYSRKEAAYRMKLSIGEKKAPIDSAMANIRLRTNLNTNISGESTISDRKHVSQMKLDYTNTSGKGRRANGTRAQKFLDFRNLEARSAYDRIYQMKISVYKAGAAEKGFPEEDLIASLDGSKEN